MSLITLFDPWKSNLCTCPEKYSLSPYTGCSHNCLYCYASSYIVNFKAPREKKNYKERLHRELKKIPPGSTITLSNSSDPYLHLEKEKKLTRFTLKTLAEHDLKILIVTKSNLILRDMDLLKNLKKVVVCITITTLDDTLAKTLEPNAPSAGLRLKTIKELSSFLPVACRFDPLIYPLNTRGIKEVIKEIKASGAKQIITSTYKTKPDNFKRMIKAFPEHKKVWQEFYLTHGEKKGRYTYLPYHLRHTILEEVKTHSQALGISCSTCREDMPEFQSTVCDGSALFNG